MRIVTAVLALTATLAQAQDGTPLTGPEFDAAVTGNTVHYNDGTGQYAGAEAYHPNNRVTWVAQGGTCQKGTWYASGPEICFLYEGQSRPVCWQFFRDQGRLMASPSSGSPPWTAFQISPEPIGCTSPFVGS